MTTLEWTIKKSVFRTLDAFGFSLCSTAKTDTTAVFFSFLGLSSEGNENHAVIIDSMDSNESAPIVEYKVISLAGSYCSWFCKEEKKTKITN